METLLVIRQQYLLGMLYERSKKKFVDINDMLLFVN